MEAGAIEFIRAVSGLNPLTPVLSPVAAASSSDPSGATSSPPTATPESSADGEVPADEDMMKLHELYQDPEFNQRLNT